MTFSKCVFIAFFSLSMVAQTSSPPAKPPNKKQAPSPTLTERALRFLGVSATPGTLKGASDVRNGQVWIATLKSNTRQPLAQGANYRSPIFLPGSDDLLVVQGDDVLRASIHGGEPRKACTVNRLIKLVGAGTDDRNAVLLLLKNPQSAVPAVATLDLRTCNLTEIPFDASSPQSRQTLEDLQGWTRSYGDRRLLVQRQSKDTLSGTQEWTDVFLQTGNNAPQNVSQCLPDNCAQPSLDPDALRIVFIRSEP